MTSTKKAEAACRSLICRYKKHRAILDRLPSRKETARKRLPVIERDMANLKKVQHLIDVTEKLEELNHLRNRAMISMGRRPRGRPADYRKGYTPAYYPGLDQVELDLFAILRKAGMTSIEARSNKIASLLKEQNLPCNKKSICARGTLKRV